MSFSPKALVCTLFAWTAAATTALNLPNDCPVFFENEKICEPTVPASFLPESVENVARNRPPQIADDRVFADLLDALNVTQAEYFAPWLGTWPDSIDWTGAVVGTHVSGAIRSISEDLYFLQSKGENSASDWKRAANLIDDYFTQIVGYYFGQDAFAIRNEAYDDILWVVLGWLETVKFIDAHNALHYTITETNASETASGGLNSMMTMIPDQPYHGNVWIPAFAHRARVFWEVGSHGWDTKLCNGGMTWNPRLEPYKNAITNELYIAASMAMYLYFPGDNNTSPFSDRNPRISSDHKPYEHSASSPRNATYLKAAVEGYRWLRNINMTNDAGLFVDGFHISGYSDEHSNNTRCDARAEGVYSYNQGVVLTGQRGLWDATGAVSFLDDGHRLVQKVINATGYDLETDRPLDVLNGNSTLLPKWHGLGRLGVMEDSLDASGTASQDLQTFKGIFFHHLTAFCEPLEMPREEDEGLRVDMPAFEEVRKRHADACRAYGGWLGHNVHAARGTRDGMGRYGQWWTAGLLMEGGWEGPWPTLGTDGVDRERGGGADYRDYGVPAEGMGGGEVVGEGEGGSEASHTRYNSHHSQVLLRGDDGTGKEENESEKEKDPNDRGRGRTVETQSGGLALLRAYWKIARIP
ncbi:glycosyl hydrolase family 76-domain-containing protein [Astrocystis sublimbata]|nr:glycosyl hydrolase family 76-domain-containing protein [Astrocystis sublimbata]